MGAHLGAYFYYLEAHFVALRTDWIRYRALYGDGPERIDLINRSASFFFFRVSEILWEAILLGIARFIDGNRESVSLKRLIFVIRDKPLKDRLLLRLKETEQVCHFAKHWRDNHIAHRNENAAFDKQNYPLKHASRHSVEVALKASVIF